MNQPDNKIAFKPKQALAPTAELYDALVGDGMVNLAHASIAEIPPVTPGAIIHDNGCGTGSGTAALLSSLPPTLWPQITLLATDIHAPALTLFTSKAREHNWPIPDSNIRLLDSNDLSGIPDNHFTLSLNNALFFALPQDGVPAMREALRTLRPGGTLVANSWAHLPNMEALQAAHVATRPVGTPAPREGLDKWNDAAFMRARLEEAGFEREKIRIVRRDVDIETVEVHRFAEMLWSFIGGTGKSGWSEEDERVWDDAVGVIKEVLGKSDGYEEVEGEDGERRLKLRFVANVAVASK